MINGMGAGAKAKSWPRRRMPMAGTQIAVGKRPPTIAPIGAVRTAVTK